METKEIEQKYLSENHKFHTERKLLSTFTINDIKDFIKPLYNEYGEIKSNIDTKIREENSKHDELWEVGMYLIEKVIDMNNNWERKNELEDVLNTFNSHLYSYHSPKYTSTHTALDIKDVPIARVIWMYTKLPSNIRKNIKCPLHNDKTPSFKIYEDTNSFFCFGCNRWWNVLNFVSLIENITTKEAYKKLLHQFW